MPFIYRWSSLAIVATFVFFVPTSSIQAQETISFTVTNGAEIRCASDSIVDITISPNLLDAFIQIDLLWGDGSFETILPGESMNRTHTFSTYEFLQECSYSCAANPLINGFCFNISLVATYNTIPDENNAKIIAYKIPPIVEFLPDNSIICEGDEVCFGSSTCPNNDNDMVYTWNFGDGSIISSPDTCIIYNDEGNYIVTLTATNSCGSDTKTETIMVLGSPTAAVLFSDSETGGQDTVACVPYSVHFSNQSINGTAYQWQIFKNDSLILDSIAAFALPLDFTFDMAGSYKVVMTTGSECGNVVWEQLFIIEEPPVISLNPAPIACDSLLYKPSVDYGSGSIDSYTWVFEGGNPPVSNDSLPTDILFNTLGAHQVTLVAENFCGVDTSSTTITIQTLEPVIVEDISSPICNNEANTFLIASPPGGIWSGAGITDSITGAVDFSSIMGGIHTYTYTILEGTTCEASGTLDVEIIDIGTVEAGQNALVCEDENSIQLTGSDNNTGIWSGTAVDAQGLVNISALDTGLHTFIYTIEHIEFNCSQTDSLLLSVLALPQIAFSADTACVNTETQFVNETTAADTYLWDFGTNISMNENPVYTFNTTGDFPVTLTAFTEGNICENTLEQIIHVSEPPALAAIQAVYQDSCAPLSIVLNNNSLGENLSYNWYDGDQLINQEQGPINMILPSARTDTTYFFRLEVSNTCGIKEDLDSILVAPLPVSFFGLNQNNYCSGETVELVNISYGDPISYFWDFGDSSIPNSTEATPPPIIYTVDSTTVRTISLLTSNECGSDTLSYDILIHPIDIQAFFNTPDDNVCVGDSICLTNFSTFGADIIYDFGDGNTTTDANPCHQYETAGIYEIKLIATACGTDTITKTITVHPAPELDFIAPSVCLNTPINIINNSVNAVQYSWDFGDNNTSTATLPNHVYDSIGLYTISLIAASENGCSSTLSQPIEVLGLPEARFDVVDSLCAGMPIVFTNNSINSTTCEWHFGDEQTATDCNPTHLYSNNDAIHIVTLIVSNDAACLDSIAQMVYTRATPIPAFEFPENLCNPALIPLTNLSQGADSYEWTFSNGATSTAINPEVFFNTDGTFTASLLATNDGLCSASIEQEITIHAYPEAIFTPSTPSICANDELTFNNQSTGDIITQQWEIGPPDGIVSFDESPTFILHQGGDFVVELIVNTEFCADTTQQAIEVFDALEASTETHDLVCFEEATGAIAVTMDTGSPPFQYDWSNGEATPGISELSEGQYTLNITDNNSCRLMLNFDINQPPPITAIIVEQNLVSCFGGNDGSILIQAAGGTADYQYNWATGTTGASIANLPAGDYEFTITDANGCTITNTLPIGQNAPIEIVDSIIDISCFGYGDGEIYISAIEGGSPLYNLTLEGPVNYQQVNRRFGELLAGHYELTLEDAEGCVQTYSYDIEEPDPIFINIIQEDTTIALGEYVDLTSNFNAVNPIFVWNPEKGLDCQNCFNPQTRPFRDVTYEVTMIDENGCVVSDKVSIKVDLVKDVFVPDAFTPNGDGHNDVFRIRSIAKSILNIQEFTVVDRWGQLFFQAKDYPLNDIAGEWNGTGKDGNKASPGVYVWYAIINYVDGTTETLKGDITLIR